MSESEPQKLERTLPPMLAQAIGQFIANFAVFENTLATLFKTTAETRKEIGSAITSGMSFQLLLHSLSSLIQLQIKDESLRDQANGIIVKAFDLESYRNRLVHSFLFSAGEPDMLMSLKTSSKHGKGFNRSLQEISIKELREKCDTLARLSYNILILAGAVEEHLEEPVLEET